MNWDQLAGNWKQISGAMREKWSKLTDHDLEAANARRDILVGKIQERYGLERERAEQEVDRFVQQWKPNYENEDVAVEGDKVDSATLKKGM